MTYPFRHCWRCKDTPDGLHFCHRCDTAKPLSEFYRAGSGGIEAGCKNCRRTASRDYARTVLGSVPRPPRKEKEVTYRPKVQIRRGKAPDRARCVTPDCGWVMPGATRERARQHAADNGHTVHFVIPDVTVYTPLERTA